MSKVTSSLKPDPRWDVEPLEPAAELAVEKILDQPFHYFGSGGECYVFLSQDGKTIMKVFKHYRMRTNLFCKDWPLPAPLKTYVDSHQERFERIFTSCKIAYDDLREEAGLVYVHLNKTDHLKKKLILTDKINVRASCRSRSFGICSAGAGRAVVPEAQSAHPEWTRGKS